MHSLLPSSSTRNQGLALIVVTCLLGLMMLLVVAVFTISESDLRSAKHYSSGQQARQLSEVATNVVMAQLRQGTAPLTTAASGRSIWISQPGVIRKYGSAGTSTAIYKLYSSSQMVLQGSGLENSLLKDVPPQDWETQPLRYADLNRPLARADASGSVRLLFPIIDPRAMTGGTDTVSGFSYSNKFANGSTIDGVTTTGGDAQRLPMPVEWLYVLRDGSFGTLDSSNKFTGAGTVSSTNPIVGRIAFWADDESSKVNINTASEPTFWALPSFFHQRDADWSKYQPVNGEFQRYPGHPATTALSPILYPNAQLTWQDKDLIYNLVPKVGPGGTHSATVAYSDPTIAAVKLSDYRKEHLYASLDEFLLKDDRTPNNFGTDASVGVDKIQRTSFFLTAHSKAPEVNPFGQPKIAMWPISYRTPTKDYRSAFDNLIAFCSTLSGTSSQRLYEFQRGYAHSTTADVNFGANQDLLNYLLTQLKKPIPGFGISADKNFSNKYGDDLPQLLVETFDYIRSTNLYDGNLSGQPILPSDTTANVLYGYSSTTPYTRPETFKTFTDPRFTVNGTDPDTGQAVQNEFRGFPGHGQVAPSQWTNNGKTFGGIARFPTISQVGLQFICAADNTNDTHNPFTKVDDSIGQFGGSSAPKVTSTDNNVKDRWYSNFPPTPSPDPTKKQAANMTKYPKTQGYPYGSDTSNPGYNPVNWNWQLSPNTPLALGKRRVQARLVFEFFIPADGYTIIEPDFTVQVSGLSKFKLGTQALFQNDTETVRSGRRATHNGTTQNGGYDMGVKGFMRERQAPARAPMIADSAWSNADWQVKPSSSDPSTLSVLSYDLLSNFVDIDVGADGSTPMNVSAADVQIVIYTNHLGKIATAPEVGPLKVQTLQVSFPQDTVKAPTLVRNAIQTVTTAAGATLPSVEPPYWWSFYSRGCMGFSVATLKAGTAAVIHGRYYGTNAAPESSGEPRIGAFFYGFDPVITGSPRTYKPQQSTASTEAQVQAAEEAEGSDVVQSMIIKHGDFRLTAAMPVVDKGQWQQNRNWGTYRLAHQFAGQTSNELAGYDYGGTDDLANRLVPNSGTQKYPNSRIPSVPYFDDATTKAQRYGDFDNAFGPDRDGPYINKPDEGSLGGNTGLAYFVGVNNGTLSGSEFFTPNRQVASPVMFGSLPSGIQAGDPWRTLLFRPQQGHPGGSSARGGQDPPDHLLLEFFWMPVVEPYSISETFATAGKVNLNYQIFPFTNIRRASALYAVMKNEMITAVDEKDMAAYKSWPVSGDNSTYWQDSDGKTWDYNIDVDKTLAQFDARFTTGNAFLSPSEICDLYLVPKNASGVTDYTQMENFWSTRRLTGDNTRERPYSTIYPRLTTRSNTFRVHYIAQSINKARSTKADTMDAADQILSEHRGSAVIERYLDSTQKNFPDFATDTTGDSLDNYYQYRVIEVKKFGS